LIANFAAQLINPEYINSLIARTRYNSIITSEEEGARFLLFILVAAFFGFTALYKVDLKVLSTKYWKVGRSIAITIGWFVVFKIISGIYLQIGVKLFDVKIDDLTSIPNILLSSRTDIDALLANYGNGVGFLIIGFVGPCFEEIFFRGVILDSCKRYLNFNFANILQSALFATIHYNLFLFPVFFSFGILTGILRKRSGGMFSGIVFHIINNILAVAVMIAMAHK
jgi:membrane protease YdiL (CAAX protease family)